jgi:hypothetical protein
MPFTVMRMCIAAFSLTTLLYAQTKISGTAQCGKPETQQKVEIPDHPGHTMSISQAKCTWTKPIEIGGIQAKEGVTSGTDDVRGNNVTSHGYYVDTMANGDKAFVHFQGTGSVKEGTSEGKWSYSGGSGKLTGLKGHGTYNGKAAADGSVTFDVEGEYELTK